MTGRHLRRDRSGAVVCVLMLVTHLSQLCRAGPVVTPAALNTTCIADGTLYGDGQEVSGATCERCVCSEGRVRCERRRCPARAGCRALHRPDRCCPEYQCDCELDGRLYTNGEKLSDPADPCRVCYCQGGEVVCRRVACFLRADCAPRRVPGRCCPEYDSCPLPGAPAVTQAASSAPAPPDQHPRITIKEITPVSEIPADTSPASPAPPARPAHPAAFLPDEEDASLVERDPAFPPIPDDLLESGDRGDEFSPELPLASTPFSAPSGSMLNTIAALPADILDIPSEVSEDITGQLDDDEEHLIHFSLPQTSLSQTSLPQNSLSLTSLAPIYPSPTYIQQTSTQQPQNLTQLTSLSKASMSQPSPLHSTQSPPLSLHSTQPPPLSSQNTQPPPLSSQNTQPPPLSSRNTQPPPLSSQNTQPPPLSSQNTQPPPLSSRNTQPPPLSSQNTQPPPLSSQNTQPPPLSSQNTQPPPLSSQNTQPPPLSSRNTQPPPLSSRNTQPPPLSSQNTQPPPLSSRNTQPPPLSSRNTQPPPLSSQNTQPPPLSSQNTQPPPLSSRNTQPPPLSSQNTQPPPLSSQNTQPPPLSSQNTQPPPLSSRNTQPPPLSSRNTQPPPLSSQNTQPPPLSSQNTQPPLLSSQNTQPPPLSSPSTQSSSIASVGHQYIADGMKARQETPALPQPTPSIEMTHQNRAVLRPELSNTPLLSTTTSRSHSDVLTALIELVGDVASIGDRVPAATTHT